MKLNYKNEEITLEEAVYRALGAASMCWEPRPEGVFDSTRADEIGKELMKHISGALANG